MTVQIWQAVRRAKLHSKASRNARYLTTYGQNDTRNRLSNFWTPTGGISAQDGEQDDSHALLVRGGFLRQAHSGVFHLLPLGLRVQDKLEQLIDRHMRSIGASKLSLSSITTEALWKQSGRYSSNSELLRIKDRKSSEFLLSPTHEEEITSLVAGMVHSYKDLPLRLYQVGRKYRDERRPRQGLLRAKEFLMKDLYTFDHTPEAALSTYQAVRTAYNNVFNELKVPYLVADADSGNMGGKLSHEYHFASPKGEDNVWSCDTCEYVANEELVEKRVESSGSRSSDTLVFTGISMDRTTRIDIHVPRPTSMAADAVQPTWIDVHSFLNLHALKKTGIDIDTGIEASTLASLLPKTTQHSTVNDPSLDLMPTREGDACPRCSNGHLNVCKAIEVAHTFHLGTRYSLPLNLLITTPDHPKPQPVHMGCHGIGLSRLIGATASLLSSPTGLHWPRAIAPFEVAVLEPTHVSTGGENAPEEASDGQKIYDELTDRRDFGLDRSGLDVVLDDRPKSLGWKLKDADLIGYPVLVVLGRAWKDKAEVEVQCRRLGVKKEVRVENLRDEVLGLLDRV